MRSGTRPPDATSGRSCWTSRRGGRRPAHSSPGVRPDPLGQPVLAVLALAVRKPRAHASTREAERPRLTYESNDSGSHSPIATPGRIAPCQPLLLSVRRDVASCTNRKPACRAAGGEYHGRRGARKAIARQPVGDGLVRRSARSLYRWALVAGFAVRPAARARRRPARCRRRPGRARRIPARPRKDRRSGRHPEEAGDPHGRRVCGDQDASRHGPADAGRASPVRPGEGRDSSASRAPGWKRLPVGPGRGRHPGDRANRRNLRRFRCHDKPPPLSCRHAARPRAAYPRGGLRSPIRPAAGRALHRAWQAPPFSTTSWVTAMPAFLFTSARIAARRWCFAGAMRPASISTAAIARANSSSSRAAKRWPCAPPGGLERRAISSPNRISN